MSMFVLQVVGFIAVAFGLGCLFGCWLKGWMSSRATEAGAAGAVTHEGAAKTSTAGDLGAPRPHYEPETAPQPSSALISGTGESSAETPSAAAVPANQASVTAKKPRKPKTNKAATAKTTSGAPGAKTTASKARAAKTAAGAAKAKTEQKSAAKPRARKGSAVAVAVPDNLKQIKGVGPAIEAKLNSAGITNFAQIAGWTKKEQASFAEQLSFAGRIEREDWVAQAKVLAKGGATEFSQRVAKGEVESSAGRKSKGKGKS